jgi:hypothetical protein
MEMSLAAHATRPLLWRAPRNPCHVLARYPVPHAKSLVRGGVSGRSYYQNRGRNRSFASVCRPNLRGGFHPPVDLAIDPDHDPNRGHDTRSAALSGPVEELLPAYRVGRPARSVDPTNNAVPRTAPAGAARGAVRPPPATVGAAQGVGGWHPEAAADRIACGAPVVGAASPAHRLDPSTRHMSPLHPPGGIRGLDRLDVGRGSPGGRSSAQFAAGCAREH